MQRPQPPMLSAADVRAIVGEVSGAAVAILRTECENLSARLQRMEERFALVEKTAAARAIQPAPVAVAAPVAAPAPVFVAAAPVAAQVAPAAAPAPVAAVAAPAPVAPKPAPVIAPRAPDIAFDLTPDSTDLPFADGARRQRRVLFTVLFVLLLGVGAAAVAAITSQSNYTH